MKTLQFLFCLIQTGIRASIHSRGAFLLESGLMILNNLIFLSIWWIFFYEFDAIGGWKMNDMVILTIVGSGSYGLMQVCSGGVKQISRMIQDGDLDCFMIQPKNILIHVVASKSLAKGWGHLMTSFILTVLCGLYSPLNLVLITVSIFSGGLVFTSVNIIAHSLPFWLGSIESVSRKYCDSVFLFALYPTNIYSGFMQVLLFTLIPAGVIGYMPVELIREFTFSGLAILLTTALGFACLAYLIFFAGLKRYESGNKFGASRS